MFLRVAQTNYETLWGLAKQSLFCTFCQIPEWVVLLSQVLFFATQDRFLRGAIMQPELARLW